VKSVVKATVKDYDGIIADYARNLASLIEQFHDSKSRDTHVVVYRIQTMLQTLSEQSTLFKE